MQMQQQNLVPGKGRLEEGLELQEEGGVLEEEELQLQEEGGVLEEEEKMLQEEGEMLEGVKLMLPQEEQILALEEQMLQEELELLPLASTICCLEMMEGVHIKRHSSCKQRRKFLLARMHQIGRAHV